MKHLSAEPVYLRQAFPTKCFTILDSASTYHQLKIKEALHILWEKPVLSKEVQHLDVSSYKSRGYHVSAL